MSENKKKALPSRRFEVAVFSIIGLIFLTSAMLSPGEFLSLFPVPQYVLLGFGLFFILFASGILVMSYLQQDDNLTATTTAVFNFLAMSSRLTGFNYLNRIADLHEHSRISRLEKTVAKIQERESGITEARSEELSSEIISSLKDQAGQELWNEITKLGKENEQQAEIEQRYIEARARLLSEVSALGRRGNLNLTLGILTTVTGLVFLSYFVILSQTQNAGQDITAFAISFLPRLSLVVMIELFSLFFLKLYKSGLSEIKYFQNEITNLELKNLALKSAMHSSTPDLIKEVVVALAHTERNHLLEKGQSTIELEKYKVDQGNTNELLKIIPRLIKRP